MENKKQTALDLLWFGKNGNTWESLLFAVFIFLFSFALTTAPDAMRPGAQVIVGTANGIVRGYELTIRRLDSNIAVLPEITAGMQREIGTRLAVIHAQNQETVACGSSPRAPLFPPAASPRQGTPCLPAGRRARNNPSAGSAPLRGRRTGSSRPRAARSLTTEMETKTKHPAPRDFLLCYTFRICRVSLILFRKHRRVVFRTVRGGSSSRWCWYLPPRGTW